MQIGFDLSDKALADLKDEMVKDISAQVTESVAAVIRELLTAQDDDDPIDLREVLKITSKSKSDVYRGVKEGRYPRPITAENKERRWRRSDWMRLLKGE